MSVKIKNPNPRGILTEGRLKSFERALDVELPIDYREFLLAYNGGTPEPNGFVIDEGKGEYRSVDEFESIHDHPPKRVSLDDYPPEAWGVPKHLLVIAGDGFGNYICLAIRGEERGTIFFMDHDIHGDDQHSMIGITKLAGSFTEFLTNLIDLDSV